MSIVYGLIGIAVSYLMLRYRKQVIDFTGSWSWAETYLGSGGSYSGVVLVAIVMFFLSLGIMTGTLDAMLQGTVGRLFG